MGVVSFFAVGIDELREVFSGSDAVASRLRTLAASAYPPPPPAPPKGNLLSRLGPFSKRGTDAPVIRPGVPSGSDLDDLLHGHEVAPDRLSAVWALVGLWLRDAAWGEFAFELDEHAMDAFDFELSAAGVDPRFGLRRVLNDQLALPLKPLPGQVTGYVRGAHGRAMASAWAAAVDRLPDDARDVAVPVAAWLGRFGQWEGRAAVSGRPAPDLVVEYRLEAQPIS